MKYMVFVVVLSLGVLDGRIAGAVEGPEVEATAGDEGVPYGGKGGMVLGGYLGFGITTLFGNAHVFYNNYGGLWNEIREDDQSVKFAGGGCVYFDYYFAPFWAVEAGLGFTGKGTRYKGTATEGEFKAKLRFMYLEIPIMAKVNYKHFQVSAGLALSVALSGIQTLDDGADNISERFGSNDWRVVNRVNVGPRIGFGYAIPVGPVHIIPSIVWSIHLVDELNDDDIEAFHDDARDFRSRATNLMFNAGVDWGLDI